MGNIATNGGGEGIFLDAVTHYVHSGFVRGFYNEDTDLDTGENLDTLIVTGSKPVHIVLDLQAFGGQVVAYIYEGCKYSAEGTILRTSRFNRTINLPVEMMAYTGPTITDVGDVFVKRRVLAHAQGNSGITSNVSTGVERVLAPFTSYLLRQTAVSDNIAVTLVGVFREAC
jgi:hypothetical protein